MKTIKLSTLLLILLVVCCGYTLSAQDQETNNTIKTETNDKDKLVVVWTSGDRDVALKMVFMYVYNAKKYGWWKDITLLVWGPSSKLLSEDKELQKQVKAMMKKDVYIMACKACADMYKVSDKLSELGITVKYAGKDLTDFIKKNHVVTF